MSSCQPAWPRFSLTEIDGLCRKAARGAGCPWGLAEEAGRAARWLAAYGLPGPEALAALLEAPRSCACGGDARAPRCAVAHGAALSDEAAAIIGQGGRAFGAVAQPLLMLAQAGQSAEALGVPLTMQWSGFRATVSPDGLTLERDDTRGAAIAMDVVCVPGQAPSASRPMDSRSRPVDATAWATLERLAARTYAPATDASRLSGAGASNLDRD